jgi:hypothetical protein
MSDRFAADSGAMSTAAGTLATTRSAAATTAASRESRHTCAQSPSTVDMHECFYRPRLASDGSGCRCLLHRVPDHVRRPARRVVDAVEEAEQQAGIRPCGASAASRSRVSCRPPLPPLHRSSHTTLPRAAVVVQPCICGILLFENIVITVHSFKGSTAFVDALRVGRFSLDGRRRMCTRVAAPAASAHVLRVVLVQRSSFRSSSCVSSS